MRLLSFRYSFLPATLLLSALFLSCRRENEKEKEETSDRTVILYLEARNNLYTDACRNIDSVLTHASAEEIGRHNRLLIYLNGGTYRQPRLLKVVPGPSGHRGFTADTVLLKSYDVSNTLTPEFMGQVLEDARTASPSDEYGLILWSHSQGWIPKSSITRSGSLRSAPGEAFTKWFGYDNDGNSMDISELREALELHEWKYILMDACFGASIEALYELRNCCAYWVGSPVEIMSTGFPYHAILPSLFKKDVYSGMMDVCRTYMTFYDDAPDYPSAAISFIDMAEIDKLASCTAALVEVAPPGNLSKPDFSAIQSLDDCFPALFYDFDGYMRSAIGYDSRDTLTASSRETIEALYQTFLNQLDKAVLFHDHTEFIYSYLSGYPRWIQIDCSVCGFSSYIPRTDFPKGSAIHSRSLKAYPLTSWAQAIGL